MLYYKIMGSTFPKWDISGQYLLLYSDSLDNSLDTQKPGFKSGAHQRFCKTLKYYQVYIWLKL